MADAEEDTWEDDEPAAEKPAAPKVIMIGRVIRDFFPETSTRRHLTLLLDELVYVFAKESPEGPGWWEGETRGEPGCFQPEYIEEVKP